MIFDPESLLELVADHAAKQHVPVPVALETMRAIVAEAERLAGDRVEDEPAALFYACALHAAALGKIAPLCQGGADASGWSLLREHGRWQEGHLGNHATRARAMARRTVAKESAT